VVWAVDFQFDADEHGRLMALHTCGGSRVSPPPTRSMRSR
jgi:hypothetical protein